MSNNFKNLLIGVLAAIVVIAIAASAYTAFAASAANESNNTSSFGSGNRNGNGNEMQFASIPASDLSAEEAAGLLFMREEEKLARDVYNQMYGLWGQPVFQNIASSEQTHMDEVKELLDHYGLTDPAQAPGQFSDAALQALYDQLIAQGSISQAEALKVGALIEQTDINDLQAHLAQTDNADIQMVYNNLMSGSYNHLSAFTGGTGKGRSNGQGNGSGQGMGGGNGQGGNGRGNGNGNRN